MIIFYTLLIEWILTASAPVSKAITELMAAASSPLFSMRLIEWIRTPDAPVSSAITALIAAQSSALFGISSALCRIE